MSDAALLQTFLDAIRRDDKWEVRRLLQADPGLGGETPLHKAAAGGSAVLAEALLDRGADPNADPTVHGHPIDLCDLQDIAMVQLLKGRGGHRSPFRP